MIATGSRTNASSAARCGARGGKVDGRGDADESARSGARANRRAGNRMRSAASATRIAIETSAPKLEIDCQAEPSSTRKPSARAKDVVTTGNCSSSDLDLLEEAYDVVTDTRDRVLSDSAFDEITPGLHIVEGKTLGNHIAAVEEILEDYGR